MRGTWRGLGGRLGGRLGGGLKRGLQKGLGRGVAVELSSGQVWFSLEVRFNSLELDSEGGRLVCIALGLLVKGRHKEIQLCPRLFIS